ncbi:MAG: L,D-transpeptidase family protein [Neisseriaceae bacterium]|nr:MAG: L,D-transpeptidase family protein [Neisseriaceae bacterium]
MKTIQSNLILFSVLISLSKFNFSHTYLLPDIAVSETENHIVINIPNVRLYVYKEKIYDIDYPIAVGKGLSQTPVGNYQIGVRAHNPTWYIPLSIQKERKQKGLEDVKKILPGADNPLGPLFIRFGESELGLGIHGTNVPSSVPGIRSHGCIRMKNEDIIQLDKKIKKGDFVSITYQLYALNLDDNNQLWFQKYPNPYKLEDQNLQQIKTTLNLWEQETGQLIDKVKLSQALKKSQPKPICLTCTQKFPKISGKLQSIAWTEGKIEIRATEYSRTMDKMKIDEFLFNPMIKLPQSIWEPKPQKTVDDLSNSIEKIDNLL